MCHVNQPTLFYISRLYIAMNYIRHQRIKAEEIRFLELVLELKINTITAGYFEFEISDFQRVLYVAFIGI